jgi:hypothetical protein
LTLPVGSGAGIRDATGAWLVGFFAASDLDGSEGACFAGAGTSAWAGVVAAWLCEDGPWAAGLWAAEPWAAELPTTLRARLNPAKAETLRLQAARFQK